MKVLVTGGAGFIGSHLVDALVARGDRCTVLDDLSRGDRANLTQHGSSVRLIEGSVADEGTVAEVVPGHDAVFHLASVVGVRSTIADPARVIEVAVVGTSNVLRHADPGARVLLASSSEVYGRSADSPFDEDSPSILGPPAAARWSYAHAKACMEHLGLAGGPTRPFPSSVVRYFNVYGPRMPRTIDPSVVSLFIDAAMAGEPLHLHGGGGQTRSFVFVQDAVEGTIAALDGAAGRVVNLGGPGETSIETLASMVITAAGSASDVRVVDRPSTLGETADDPPRRSATGALAAELLGWAPQTSLADGLGLTCAAWPTDTTTSPAPTHAVTAER